MLAVVVSQYFGHTNEPGGDTRTLRLICDAIRCNTFFKRIRQQQQQQQKLKRCHWNALNVVGMKYFFCNKFRHRD